MPKLIPKLILGNKSLLILFWVLYFCFNVNICNAKDKLYYMQFNVTTIDGKIVSSNLQMLPVGKEYRAEKFSWFKIEGFAKPDLPKVNQTKDIESIARHDALKQLLVKYGLKSVASTNVTRNNVQTDKTVMSYEGVIKKPYVIINKGYLKELRKYHIKMSVNFSPIAFPDRWSFLYMKNQFDDTIDSVLSIFR